MSIENEINGSCLTVVAEMKAIRRDLVAAIQALNALSAACKELDAKYGDEAHGSLAEALREGFGPFKDVLARFDSLVDFDKHLANGSRGSIDDPSLQTRLDNGLIHAAATDEGFARAKMWIEGQSDPFARMNAAIWVTGRLTDAIAEYQAGRERKMQKMKQFVERSRGTNCTGVQNEARVALAKLTKPDEATRPLANRIEEMLGYFFEARKALIRPICELSAKMRSVYASAPGKSGTQALRYDVRSDLEELCDNNDWFVSPPKDRPRKPAHSKAA